MCARLNGFYNGIRTLVPWSTFVPDPLQNETHSRLTPKGKRQETEYSSSRYYASSASSSSSVPMEPQVYDPYPNYTSRSYLADHYPVHECFLDVNDTISAPDIFNYPGVPQEMTMPYFGSYKELGMQEGMCFERFGRFGPYGYGYDVKDGGLGLGLQSEKEGSEAIWDRQAKIDYRRLDWGASQKRCYEKNKDRFNVADSNDLKKRELTRGGMKTLPRTAYVLRTWTGFEYTAHEILTLRSMINELSLKSGGEYDVHLLLHVRDDNTPIWSSKDVYRKVIEENIPREFWGITTLWSVALMRMYYPGPFDNNFENPSEQPIHGVYRGAHLPMQWFAQQHPEYDYMWNWEMDVRYSGHNYDFHTGVAEWAKKQPRRGLWERSSQFWIPSIHGDYDNFTRLVESQTVDKGGVPVWGPATFPNRGMVQTPKETKPPHGYFDDGYEWGVGEEADLITFNPIFDVSKTAWVFDKDITGYSLDMPIPPRRCAIITVARLSRRLLNLLHEETYNTRHSAFPEMWPPTVALHHGLKAVYIPHPVYFDRNWPLDYMDQVFNKPVNEIHSVYGWGEHNWLGSSFYYNSGFSGALWRRWLGERENNEGGYHEEMEGTGRMCLRPILHHPIKNENLPTD